MDVVKTKLSMRTKLLFIGLLFSSALAFSQETDSTVHKNRPSLTASADAYYRYNTNAPIGLYNNFTRFTASQNSFELGMASVTLSHAYKRVSAVIDVGFGRRAEELNYTDGDHPSLFAVKQAYMAYSPSERWRITVGKFFANTGYERVDAYQNEHYSLSYLFTYGPLFFTGLKTEVRLKGRTYLVAGIANPADFTTTASSTKTVIAAIRTSGKSGRLQAELNYNVYTGLATPRLLTPSYVLYKGSDQVNLTVRDSVSAQFTVGATGRFQSVDDGQGPSNRRYGGGALFLGYRPKQNLGFHLRTEYLVDNNALKIGGKIFETTLSGNIRIDDHLRFIPELRYDRGSIKIFQDGDLLGTNSTFSALAAAVYVF